MLVAGREPSTADAALFPTYVFMEYLLPKLFGWDDIFAKRPRTREWWDAMRTDTCGARVYDEVRADWKRGTPREGGPRWASKTPSRTTRTGGTIEKDANAGTERERDATTGTERERANGTGRISTYAIDARTNIDSAGPRRERRTNTTSRENSTHPSRRRVLRHFSSVRD